MRLYFILLLFICFGATTAQESLSLSQAIEIGLANNYQIKIAEKNIEVSQNNNDWGAAGRYPSLNFILTNQNSFSGQNNPAGFLQKFNSIGTGLTANLDANWVIFDGFKVNINKSRFEELEKQSMGNAQIAIENSIRSIILAYYQALIQKEQLKVLEEVLELSKDRIEYQEIRKEFGQASTFDVLQTTDSYLNDSTNLLVQQNSLATALRNLNLTMGVDDIEEIYELSDPLEYTAKAYKLADLEEKMLSDNKSLRNLYISQKLASIEREFQESNRYPKVSVNGGANWGGNASNINVKEPANLEIGNASSSNYSLYLNFSASYNIFDGGAKDRAIENAKVQEMISQLTIDDLKRNLSVQLQNTLATYNHQRQLLQLTESLIANAKRNLSISEERFKGGQINSFDYRTIQLSYINAAQSRLNAIFNLKNTETELIQLIGGLVR